MTQPTRMDPAVKARWVAELRSGRHRQGRGRLEDCGGRECCLGVLANMLGVPKLRSIHGNPVFDFKDGLLFETLLPAGFAGLSIWIQDELVKMSDGNFTFPEIADYIESNPEI